MGLLKVIVTAAIQAVTALLPVGWSTHLLLLDTLTGWPGPGAAASLAVYAGSMFAVACYFWRDMAMLIAGIGQLMRGKRDADARLLLFLTVAALPILIVAAVVAKTRFFPPLSLVAITWTSFGFGILLYIGDRIGVTVRRLSHMTWGAALAIGFAQILSLVPGSSRCGIAITVARLTGYERTEAARFSFLLALPVLAGTVALTALHIIETKNIAFDSNAYIAGITAFVVGLAAIALTMGWIGKRSFAPFALYRVIGGAAVLGWIYFG